MVCFSSPISIAYCGNPLENHPAIPGVHKTLAVCLGGGIAPEQNAPIPKESLDGQGGNQGQLENEEQSLQADCNEVRTRGGVGDDQLRLQDPRCAAENSESRDLL